VADALSAYVRNGAQQAAGGASPVLATVLRGNRAMERRVAGRPGLPRLVPIATFRVHAVPLLWRRRRPAAPGVCPAAAADLDGMADLWRRVAPARQFAPVLEAGGFATWIAAVPGLDTSSYLLARDPDGRLAGFLAVWDPSPVKRLRVTAYSRRLGAFRRVFNTAAPLAGAAPLPPPGEPLRSLTALHRPDVLRALVFAAHDVWRGRGYAFLTLGLDTREPLSRALRGLLAQPTDVVVYVTAPDGVGPLLDHRPVYLESGLV
jgi:hypothetical protein